MLVIKRQFPDTMTYLYIGIGVVTFILTIVILRAVHPIDNSRSLFYSSPTSLTVSDQNSTTDDKKSPGVSASSASSADQPSTPQPSGELKPVHTAQNNPVTNPSPSILSPTPVPSSSPVPTPSPSPPPTDDPIPSPTPNPDPGTNSTNNSSQSSILSPILDPIVTTLNAIL